LLLVLLLFFSSANGTCGAAMPFGSLRWHEPSWCGRFGCSSFCAGIRATVFAAQAVGSFASALASAICYRASSVAPVRGGTYFSLPPQRKVGKRKRLTPPAHVLIHGAPTSPHFTRQPFCLRALPTL
jgi:hypothetical protein